MNKISLLFSGRGSNAYSILKLVIENKLNFKINKIICNNKDATGIKKIIKLNLDVIIIDKKLYNDNVKYSSDLLSILNPDKDDLLLLCGYMNKISCSIMEISLIYTPLCFLNTKVSILIKKSFLIRSLIMVVPHITLIKILTVDR